MFRLAIALSVAACTGGGDGEAGRLIPAADPEFRALEQPEMDGECEESNDCEESCVHSCIRPNTAPITCPMQPEPRPTRVEGATCGCLDTRCSWQ